MKRTRPTSLPETTDLERRVFAYERILQSLIAYLSRTEPRFLDHLREQFVEPMSMARHEHDHRDSDDYAESFVLAAMLLGDRRSTKINETAATEKPPIFEQDKGPARSVLSPRPDRVQVRQRSGIWEVKVDGAFRGDYRRREQAMTAAAELRLSLS